MAWYEGKVRYFEKSVAPTTTDDKNDGFEVGDVWLDLVTNISYRCLDNSVGVAVWNIDSESEIGIAFTTAAVLGTL